MAEAKGIAISIMSGTMIAAQLRWFAGNPPMNLLATLTYCSYTYLALVWDETKRKSNLAKHGLDFKDAHLVYDNPDKCTYDSSRRGERRLMDLALAVIHGRVLALV